MTAGRGRLPYSWAHRSSGTDMWDRHGACQERPASPVPTSPFVLCPVCHTQSLVPPRSVPTTPGMLLAATRVSAPSGWHACCRGLFFPAGEDHANHGWHASCRTHVGLQDSCHLHVGCLPPKWGGTVRARRGPIYPRNPKAKRPSHNVGQPLNRRYPVAWAPA
jgi:hypothetical protein